MIVELVPGGRGTTTLELALPCDEFDRGAVHAAAMEYVAAFEIGERRTVTVEIAEMPTPVHEHPLVTFTGPIHQIAALFAHHCKVGVFVTHEEYETYQVMSDPDALRAIDDAESERSDERRVTNYLVQAARGNEVYRQVVEQLLRTHGVTQIGADVFLVDVSANDAEARVSRRDLDINASHIENEVDEPTETVGRHHERLPDGENGLPRWKTRGYDGGEVTVAVIAMNDGEVTASGPDVRCHATRSGLCDVAIHDGELCDTRCARRFDDDVEPDQETRVWKWFDEVADQPDMWQSDVYREVMCALSDADRRYFVRAERDRLVKGERDAMLRYMPVLRRVAWEEHQIDVDRPDAVHGGRPLVTITVNSDGKIVISHADGES